MKHFFRKKVRYFQLFAFTFAVAVFAFTSEWDTFAFVVLAGMYWALAEYREDQCEAALDGWKRSLEVNERLARTKIDEHLETIRKKSP